MTEINVNKIWFDHISKGNKTIEGRLNKGKFQTFKKGDIIYQFNENPKFAYFIYTSYHEETED